MNFAVVLTLIRLIVESLALRTDRLASVCFNVVDCAISADGLALIHASIEEEVRLTQVLTFLDAFVEENSFFFQAKLLAILTRVVIETA